MALQEFCILFDNPLKSYSPGDNVTGRVIATTDTDVTILGLQIRWKGQVKVKLDKDSLLDYKDYNGSIFNYATFLLGNGKKTVALPAGRNIYPFNFVIPRGTSGTNRAVPSSFRGEFGIICYDFSAVIKRTGTPKPPDVVIQESFSVNGIVDLNLCAGAGEPDEWTKQKKFYIFFCSVDSVGFKVKLAKQGFLPLEFIAPYVEVNNRSSKLYGSTYISKASVNLVQTVIYTIGRKTKKTTTVLSKIERGDVVGPGEKDVWPSSKRIQVPLVPPTGGCSGIDIQYFLRVELCISGLPFWKLKKIIPITIGTVPLLPLRNSNNAMAFTSLGNPPQAGRSAAGGGEDFNLPSQAPPSASAPPLPMLNGDGNDDITPPPSYFELDPSSSSCFFQKAAKTQK